MKKAKIRQYHDLNIRLSIQNEINMKQQVVVSKKIYNRKKVTLPSSNGRTPFLQDGWL